MQFNFADTYGSINKDLLGEAFEWAKGEALLSHLRAEVILHSRKNVLFHGEECWVKEEGKDFDIRQGNFDGADCSNLVGLYMLHQVVEVHKVLPEEDLGFYSDDIFGAYANGKKKDKKKIVDIFRAKGLKFITEAHSRKSAFS